jgi:hypothetical protein
VVSERVIQADYVNWRTVVGRKTLQLIFEIDISLQGDVLEMLGPPRTDVSVPCAIALLDMKKVKAGSQESEANGHPKKAWADYSRSQQAGILCGDPDFWRYFHSTGQEDATQRVKAHFRIASRKELDDPQKHGLWDEFVALYNLHRDRLK